ncbi:MAG TPA: glycoside hydrolase family 78 protein [Anaerolineales bacterium]|nr:glycoside hydrolase family 78 protein [Anaerolineales bacterium]
MIVTNPRCEHLIDPIGIDIARPRLSWQLQDDRRGACQNAYQIHVSSSPEALSAGSADLWDSGKVQSDRSVYIPYGGETLSSGQGAWWRVRAWDEAGLPTEWSRTARWEMGLLARSDWTGQWIGAGFAGGPQTPSPASFLRNHFDLDRLPEWARLYITALGVYEPHLNGQVVGGDVLAPGWTDYARRVQYQVYDVTDLMLLGENVLAAVLGDGWYCGFVGWGERQQYGDRPRLLAQLSLRFAGGDTRIVATGERWKASYGPILASDLQRGESYDARFELGGWDSPGYVDSGWMPVEIIPDSGIELSAILGPAVKRIQEIRPVDEPLEVREPFSSRWIYDLGQNIVGRLRLKVSGSAGVTVTLRHAEMLNPDGTIYTTNLRRAHATDHYTLKGVGEEVYEPRFTFHGFRYVELTGYPGRPGRDTITGIVLHSEMPSTGAFECSDPFVNQLQQNIRWGQRGNFLDVPTDCPQRDERLGWTGDAQVFARTAAFNMDVSGFFTKWTRDLEDAQAASGAYPPVAPMFRVNLSEDGGPAWADAGIIVPWTLYQCYGDPAFLEGRYASMQRFMDYLEKTSCDGIRVHPEYSGFRGFGDWLALDGSHGREGGTPKDLIGTAFFAHCARLLGRIARVLNRLEDAERYEALFEKVRRAFQERYVTPAGLLAGGTQTSYILALHFDLLPEGARGVALDALLRDIEGREFHLSTGFVGTPYINWVLSQNGRPEVAYALLNQKTWPSWLYSVIQGATTIWERWDGWTHDKGFQDATMNSFNHYAYGAIGAWLYAVVGGIDSDPERPGYKHIVMHPRPGGGLTRAKAELRSIYGLIRSAWRLEGGVFEWEIKVPANSLATVYVPVREGGVVLEREIPAQEAPGVTFLRLEAGAEVFEVVSGEYVFTAE